MNIIKLWPLQEKKNIYMDVQEMFYTEFMKMDGLLETHPGQETIS